MNTTTKKVHSVNRLNDALAELPTLRAFCKDHGLTLNIHNNNIHWQIRKGAEFIDWYPTTRKCGITKGHRKWHQIASVHDLCILCNKVFNHADKLEQSQTIKLIRNGGGWEVCHGDKRTGQLTDCETLGVIASLVISEQRPALGLLKSEDDWKSAAKRHELARQKRWAEERAKKDGEQKAYDQINHDLLNAQSERNELRQRNAELEAALDNATKPWLDRFADWFTKKPPRDEPDDVETPF